MDRTYQLSVDKTFVRAVLFLLCRYHFSVELHLHLDGAVHWNTIYDLAKQRGINFGNSVDEVKSRFVHPKPCASLGEFLAPMIDYIPLLTGDPDAIERVAYELCEIQAQNGVLYFEARYCPHFKSNTVNLHSPLNPFHGKGDVTPTDVVRLINKGLRRGEKDFGVTARSILCCIRTHPEWNDEMLNLCDQFRNEGVVAIDIAGSPHGFGEEMREGDVKIFQDAVRRGIHRTAHAGEAGTAQDVKDAISLLHAERIGHGYHVLDDENIYQFAKQAGVHFECCPVSSYLTHSVTCPWHEHPICRFWKDDVNFGVSTDDPTLTGHYLDAEMSRLRTDARFSDAQIAKLVKAANACFLPPEEKAALVKRVTAANIDSL